MACAHTKQASRAAMDSRRRGEDGGADRPARRARPSPTQTPGEARSFSGVIGNEALLADILERAGAWAVFDRVNRQTHAATRQALRQGAPQCEAWVAEFVDQFERARQEVQRWRALTVSTSASSSSSSSAAAAAPAGPVELRLRPFEFNTPMPELSVVRAYLHGLHTQPRTADDVEPWTFLADHVLDSSRTAAARSMEHGGEYHRGSQILGVITRQAETNGVLALARLALLVRYLHPDAAAGPTHFLLQVAAVFAQLLVDRPPTVRPNGALGTCMLGLYSHLVWRHSREMRLNGQLQHIYLPVAAVRLRPPMQLREYRWFELGPHDLNYAAWGSVLTAGGVGAMEAAVAELERTGAAMLAHLRPESPFLGMLDDILAGEDDAEHDWAGMVDEVDFRAWGVYAAMPPRVPGGGDNSGGEDDGEEDGDDDGGEDDGEEDL